MNWKWIVVLIVILFIILMIDIASMDIVNSAILYFVWIVQRKDNKIVTQPNIEKIAIYT